MFFKFKTAEISQKYYSLIEATTGEEPCYQPEFLDSPDTWLGEIKADEYTGNWTGSNNVSKATAEALCAGCPLLEMCRDYATEAQEPYGIWGGTRPIDRGIDHVVRSGKLWEDEDDD